jgi:hypothetical protein
MLAGLDIRLCDEQGFVAYIPNDIFLDKVVKRGQEPVTQRGNIFIICF